MPKEESIYYSRNIIEFVTVANEFCALAEGMEQMNRYETVDNFHKILPFLYMKAVMLPEISDSYEDIFDKYVTEEIYTGIKNSIELKMGQYDAYHEVFNEDFQYDDKPIAASISEDIADIYQDVKDFIMLYRMGTDEIVNDGVWELQNNFKLYWGQKLTNCLRALHQLRYGNVNLLADDEEENNNEEINTSDWIISKRQQNMDIDPGNILNN